MKLAIVFAIVFLVSTKAICNEWPGLAPASKITVAKRLDYFLKATGVGYMFRLGYSDEKKNKIFIDILLPVSKELLKDSVGIQESSSVFAMIISDLIEDSIATYKEVNICYYLFGKGDTVYASYSLDSVQNYANKKKFSIDDKLKLFCLTTSYDISYTLDSTTASIRFDAIYEPSWYPNNMQKIEEHSNDLAYFVCVYILRNNFYFKEIKFNCLAEGHTIYSHSFEADKEFRQENGLDG